MRAFTKILTGSAIVAATLAVSACGGSNSSNTTENTMITDMNATEGMDTMTDNMTAVDGATNGGMMANDTGAMGTDTMAGNDVMMGNSGAGNMSAGNAM